MRSASLDKRQPRRKEPQPRLAPQVFSLAVPQVSVHDAEIGKLHSRLKTVVGKLMDFVSISSELLTSQRLPEGSLSMQRKLLDELEQEKGRWEQVMFYSLAVQEDILRSASHSHVQQASSSLGSNPSDFKRLSDLVADAQNKVTVVLRRRRDDSSLSSKVWEVFTGLNQRIYEVFFRSKGQKSADFDAKETMRKMHFEQEETQRAQEEELERLRKKIREQDLELMETSGLLKSKDQDLENLHRSIDSRAFHKVESMQNSLERDLQHAREQISILEAENARFRSESGLASKQKYAQSSSFKLLKKELDRKSANIDEYLSQSRPMYMNELETNRLRNDYDLALKELDMLKAWKQKRLQEEGLETSKKRIKAEEDMNERLGRSPVYTLGDESDEDMSSRRLKGTPLKRPNSASKTEPRGISDPYDLDSMRVYLSREREKSNSFFSQLQRKEKECAELTKSAEKLRTEIEQLRGGATDMDLKFQRQQEEVNHFLEMIKNMEEEKEQGDVLIEQFRQEKLKADRELSVLRTQLASAQDSEEIMKQLRLTIEEKQKVSRAYTQVKNDLAKANERGLDLVRLRSEAEKSLEVALTENSRLESKVQSLEKTASSTKESKQHLIRDRKQLEELVLIMRQELEHQYSETVAKVEAQETKLMDLQGNFEDRLQQHREMLNEIVPKYEEKCEQLQKDLDQASESAEGFESLFRQTQKDNEFLSTSLKKAQTDLDLVQTDTKRKDAKIESLSQILRKLEAKCEELETNLYESKAQQASQEAETEESSKETALLKQELQRLQRELVDKVTQANNEIEDLELRVSNEKREKTEAEDRAKRLEADIKQMNLGVDEKEKRLAELSQIQGKLMKSIEEIRVKDEQLSGLISEKRVTQEAFERKISANEKLVQELKSALSLREKSFLESQETQSRLETQVSDLQKEVKDVNKVVVDLRSALSASSAELMKKEKSILELKTSAESDKTAHERLYAQFHDVSGKYEATALELREKLEEGEGLNSELRQAEEEVRELKDQLGNVTSKLETYKKQAIENDRRRRETEERLYTLQKDSENQFSSQLENLQNQLQTAAQKAREAEQALSQERQELSDLRLELESAQAQVLDLDKIRNGLEAKIAQIQTEKADEIYDLRQTLGEKDKGLKELTQRRDQEKKDLEGKLTAERRAKEGVCEDNENLQKRLRDMEEQLANESDQLQSETSFLESKIMKLTAESEARKATLTEGDHQREVLKAQIQAKDDLLSETSSNLKQLQSDKERLQGQLDHQTALFKQQKAALDKQKLKSGSSKQNLQTYAQEIDSLRRENERLTEQLSGALMSSEEAASLYQNLQQELRTITTRSELENSTLREQIEDLKDVLGVSGEEDEEHIRTLVRQWKAAETDLDQIYGYFHWESEAGSPIQVFNAVAELKRSVDQLSQERESREQHIREANERLESEQRKTEDLVRKLESQVQANRTLSDALKLAETARVSAVSQLESETITELEAEISVLNQQHASALTSLQDSLQLAQEENSDLEEKVSSLESLKTDLEQETARQSSEFTVTISALETRLQNKDRKLTESALQIRELESASVKHQDSIKTQQVLIEQLNQELKAAQESAAEESAEKVKLSADIERIERELRTKELEIAEMSEKAERKEGELRTLELEIIRLKEERQTQTKADLIERQSEKDALLNQIHAFTEEIKALKLKRTKEAESEDSKDAQITLLSTKVEELSETNSELLKHWHEEQQVTFAASKRTFETELLGHETSLKSIYQHVADRFFGLQTTSETALFRAVAALKHVSEQRENELFSQSREYELLTKRMMDDAETMARKEFAEVEGRVSALDSKAESVFSQCAAAIRTWGRQKTHYESELATFRGVLDNETRSKLAVKSAILAFSEQRQADMERLSSIVSHKLSEFDQKTSAILSKSRETIEQLVDEKDKRLVEIEDLKLNLRVHEDDLRQALSTVEDEKAEKSILQEEVSNLQTQLDSLETELKSKQTSLSHNSANLSQFLTSQLKEHESNVTALFSSLEDRLATVTSRVDLSALVTTLKDTATNYQQQVQTLSLQVIDKEETIMELNAQIEESAQESDEVEKARVSLQQSEVERQAGLLVRAQKKAADLEDKNKRLQKIIDEQPKAPNFFELTDLSEVLTSQVAAFFHTAEDKFSALQIRFDSLLLQLPKLRPKYRVNPAEITQLLQNCDDYVISRMNEIEESVEALAFRLDQKLEERQLSVGMNSGGTDTIAVVYDSVMDIADQLEDMIVTRVADTEKRLERLAQTTETVINYQAGQIDLLRTGMSPQDPLSGGSLERIDPKGHSMNASMEEVLGAVGDFTVCKRSRFNDDVWCLVTAGDEEKAFYWWKEDQLRQAVPEFSQWPDIEEDVLKGEIETQAKELSERETEIKRLQRKLQNLQESLQRGGFDVDRISLNSAVTELIKSREVTERERLAQAHSPIDPSSVENTEVTVLTDVSEGQRSITVPNTRSSDFELAPLVDTLGRLTTENEEQAKIIEDLTRQNDLYKEAMRRGNEDPSRRSDKLTSTVINLLEILPEQ